MTNIWQYKKIILFSGLLFIELVSFLTFLNPGLNNVIFLTILFIILITALYRLEYTVYILFAELIIGSKGYLFSLHFHNEVISIRMVIWLIIMSVWLYKYSIVLLKTKYWPKMPIPNITLFLALFAFILLGIANGLWHHNGPANIFFDFNAWLFFLLIFPISFINSSNFFNKIKDVFVSATIWLSLKTFLLLYIFSHNFFILPVVYKWVRDTGVGEITLMPNGFSRIFIQSHIYIIVAFITVSTILIFSILKRNIHLNGILFKIFISSIYLAVIFISFSRSFWVGLVAAFLITCSVVIYNFKLRLKNLFIPLAVYIITAIIAILLITAIVKFPFPQSFGNFNTTSLLTDRANELAGEAGVSSRWSLLPVLTKKILQSPIIGSGFGTTVTYRSSDPRVLAQSADGLYTTYAFEWGWLDTWIKIGFFGIGVYLYIILFFIYKIIKKTKVNQFVDNNYLMAGLVISLAAIVILNNFSPYFNHPLGIFFILILNNFLFYSAPINS
jgi:hypothetical protein